MLRITDPAHGPLWPPCPRCGVPVKPLVELADQVTRLTGRAISARDALGSELELVPSIVPAALVTLELELPKVGRCLACHAGTCPIWGAGAGP